MSCEHFAYAPQGAIGTFVPPTKAIPVISAGAGGTQRELTDGRLTGSCRSRFYRWLGAKAVSGSIVTHWWDEDIASLWKEFLTDSATTGAPTDYTHGFIPNDLASLGMLSAQFVHSTTVGESILAMVINSVEIQCASKELVQLTFNYEARDKVRSALAADAAKWDSLATASPALVVPSTMYETVARPLAFYDGVITYGGTLTFSDTSNVVTIASGVALAKILAITITIDAGLDTDGFEVAEDPTRLEFAPGDRDITVSMDVSFYDQAFTLYDLANSGVPTVISLQLFKSAVLGAEIILPAVVLDPFAMPAVTGTKAKKTYTLTGKAQRAQIVTGDPVDLDINVIILNQEAAI